MDKSIRIFKKTNSAQSANRSEPNRNTRELHKQAYVTKYDRLQTREKIIQVTYICYRLHKHLTGPIREFGITPSVVSEVRCRPSSRVGRRHLGSNQNTKTTPFGERFVSV